MGKKITWSRIRHGLGWRARKLMDHLLFFGLADWLNRSESPWMIEHRPAFHVRFGLPEFKAMYQDWIAGSALNNGGDLARLYALYFNMRQILKDDVPGDFIELGVYKGNSAAFLARFGRQSGRHTYLFDTFEGFDTRDLVAVDDNHPVAFTDTSLGGVRRLVGEEGVSYVKGYFPESLSQITIPEKVALLHIDCDLYEPMKACLEVFYGRCSPGALLILHDYASGWWPGATKAVDEFFADKPEKPVIIPDLSGTAIVRRMSTGTIS